MLANRNDILRILIADDDQDDQVFAKEIIQEEISSAVITSVFNGAELVDFLLKKNGYQHSNEEIPHVVLLDINMPFCNGLEALEKIRQYKGLKQIDFFVLSTGQREEEMQKALELGAKGYFPKPASIDTFRGIVRQIFSNCYAA